ncbi:MAG: SLC13 family permease [Myxococcota bacterium]
MSSDAVTVFAVLGGAAALFASNRVRPDAVALLALLALLLLGILPPGEALSGFGDPVVVMVAGLFVVGETLTRTGIAYSIGRWIARTAGTRESRLLVVVMGVAGVMGSIMSSTAVVAILMPVVLTVAARANLNASRLLLPLSFAALVSGMMTLIATTPNLVVSGELEAQGHEGFGFFAFLPIGLAVLGVAMVYMLLVGRRLLPGGRSVPERGHRQTLDDITGGFGLHEQRRRFRVPADSPLVGRTLAESGLSSYDFRVVGIERPERYTTRYLPTPSSSRAIRAGDVLVGYLPDEHLAAAQQEQGLAPLTVGEEDLERWHREFGSALVLVHPESSLLGKTLRESEFRTRHRLHVQGVRRKGEVLGSFPEERLAAGDTLLVQGDWARIAELQGETHDFVVLMLPLELDQLAPSRDRAPLALLIVAAMVLLGALGIVPVVVAVLLAAVAAVASACVKADDAYRSIHWSSVVLIAAMLPLADALDSTGGVDAIVGVLGDALGGSGPRVAMSVVFLLTAGLSLVLSNTASAVIVAPISVQAAELLSVSPHPFAMTVAIAASASFVTPFATPVVTLVVGPGGYRFADFVKTGLPMLLLTWGVALLLIPALFPF